MTVQEFKCLLGFHKHITVMATVIHKKTTNIEIPSQECEYCAAPRNINADIRMAKELFEYISK